MKRSARPWVFFILVCAAIPPPALQAALASAAGTVFEAAPFVLAAERAGGRLRGALLESLGCGCGGSAPGALSLPATAIAWLAFGPAVALARLAAAAALIAWRRPRVGRRASRRRDEACRAAESGARAAPCVHVESGGWEGSGRRGTSRANGKSRLRSEYGLRGELGPRDEQRPQIDFPPPDAFAELARLAPVAFIAALFREVLATLPLTAMTDHRFVDGAFVAGLCLGAVMPCATAGVAVAAALAHGAHPAAVGMLLTAGLSPRLHIVRQSRLPVGRAVERAAARARPVRLASFGLALALVTLAWRGPSGLVNPRWQIPLAAGSVLAATAAWSRRSRSRWAPAIPACLFATLVAGSPAPAYHADPTSLWDAAPGERLSFTGVAMSSGNDTTLERFAITCCRIDASPVAVRLDRRLPVADGTWVTAAGPLVRTRDGALALHPAASRVVAQPSDPFTYR